MPNSPWPASYFAKPSYRAELVNPSSGAAGVFNADGVNCMTFMDAPRVKLTDEQAARQIADRWNTHEWQVAYRVATLLGDDPIAVEALRSAGFKAARAYSLPTPPMSAESWSPLEHQLPQNLGRT